MNGLRGNTPRLLLLTTTLAISACGNGSGGTALDETGVGGTSGTGSTSSGGTLGGPGGTASGGLTGTGGAGTGGLPDGTGGMGLGGAGGSAGGSPSGGGNAGTGGSATLGALTISDLKVSVNPQMPLGVYVSWTSDQPASSEVQFGVGGYQYRVIDTTSVTAHHLLVLGMRAATAYEILAVSTNQDATGSATGAVTTGALPDFLPDRATVITPASPDAAPGYTLTNFWDGGQSPTAAVILDSEGYPVWYFVNGTGKDQFGATSTAFTYDGTILVGNATEPAREVDLEGNILWAGPTGGSAALSHHTSKLRTGNYMVVRESASSARAEELDSTNKVVWSWDLYADSNVTNDGVNDWCHLNSVSTNAAEDMVFFNCRFQGLFKIEKSSKNLLWQMGAAMDDDQTGDVTYLPSNAARFNDAHDPEFHEDGTVLLYDNQGWLNRMVGAGNGSFHSQVVEYQLAETGSAVTATLTWQFPGNFPVDSWYTTNWSTPIWGDADRLENGNVLVTAGVTGTSTGGMTPAGTKTRIFEVTRTGEVVWAIEWPEGKGSFRAERMTLPVEALSN